MIKTYISMHVENLSYKLHPGEIFNTNVISIGVADICGYFFKF